MGKRQKSERTKFLKFLQSRVVDFKTMSPNTLYDFSQNLCVHDIDIMHFDLGICNMIKYSKTLLKRLVPIITSLKV